jgi:5,10-methylenetetrahydromethanopterin reductase
MDPDWHRRLSQASEENDWETATSLISDEILDRFAYSGSAQDLIEQLNRVREEGIDRVDLGTPHGIKPEIAIRILGGEVLPQLGL